VDCDGYKDGLTKMGADLYKRLGLPNNEKVLNKQRLA